MTRAPMQTPTATRRLPPGPAAAAWCTGAGLLAAALVPAVLAQPVTAPSPVAAAASAPVRVAVARAPIARRPPPAPAQRWGSARFVYKAENRRIADVLQDFAASQGLPAVIAEGVDGTVQASFDATPEEFLNAIGKAYGTLWYHDGTALYFYPARAIQSRLFRLKGFSRTQVEELLDSLGIGDKRYPLRFSATDNTLLVYGPPRHVDLVAAALDSLDAGALERNRRVVRVIPLRFASAADRRFGETVVPGLVSTLRTLYAEGSENRGGAAEGNGSQNNGALIAKLKGLQALTGAPVPAGGSASVDQRGAQAQGAEPSSMGIAHRGLRSPLDTAEADRPQFEADEATNAVIVRSRVEHMADYIEIVRRLDRRPTLVEIEAMIIDVSSDSVDTLGIAWSAAGPRGRVGVTPPTAGPANGVTASVGAFSISTLWSNAGYELLSRIDALQANGKARVVAKPRVLGVANRAAVMKEKRVAAVRVAGNLDASLFRIEAGTHLQVTPQITEYGEPSRIKLSLYIEDGNFETGSVDGVPIVKHTEIATEAHVTEGESLLIGGITVETDSSHLNAVPGVSKLPLVGGLFQWKDAKVSRSERLFLITPRLVRDTSPTPDNAAGERP